MTFWFGIGIMQLLPKGYDKYYPDQILNKFIDKLEPYLCEEAEIREVLLEANINLFTQEEPTNVPAVIGAGLGWGGILCEETAQSVLTAVRNVHKRDSAPNRYTYNMPDPIADILIPGLSRPTETPEASQRLLKSLVSLDDFCVAPLQKFHVGGLEQHIADFTEWRDDIKGNPEFEPDEASREEMLNFYDKKLLPMLRLCQENYLIFVFCF